MSEFEKIVAVSPAFGKRDPGPKKDDSIGACLITFTLKGPKGAVQFMIGTDWHLPETQRENRRWQFDYDTRFDKIKPAAWDLGYHSPVPMYEGQKPMSKCDILPDGCYYDGSSLQADEMIPDFLAGGTDWLWAKLESHYRDQFEGGA